MPRTSKKVQTKKVDEKAVEPGQEKEKKGKLPPLTNEEYAAAVAAVVNELLPLMNTFTGPNKAKFKSQPDSPSKADFANVVKILEGTTKSYAQIAKKQKKKSKRVEGADPTVRGFNQQKLVNGRVAALINKHGNIPPEFQLELLPGDGGDAIWNIAEATQFFQHRTESMNLKDKDHKSTVTFDPVMTEIFKPYLDKISKSKWTLTAENRCLTKSNTMQALISALFEKGVLVPDSYFTPEFLKRSNGRKAYLSSLIKANQNGREAVKVAARVEREKVKAEKKAEKKAKAELADPFAQPTVHAADAVGAAPVVAVPVVAAK